MMGKLPWRISVLRGEMMKMTWIDLLNLRARGIPRGGIQDRVEIRSGNIHVGCWEITDR